MISLHFTDSEVVDFDSAADGNNDSFKKYFHGMLNEGIYLPPSAFESYFLNDALSFEDIEKTITALKNGNGFMEIINLLLPFEGI